ncbi:MAG TPA: hypothetical protein VFO16_10575 [Pseudonocardiaceae bacterium]|nr:hypothetical protein [Pseudonocardiaceae bacterium]
MTAIVLAVAGDIRPAGGAALDQIIFASVAAAVLTSGLLLLGYGHRTGRVRVLRWLADLTERWPFAAGGPGWVELPSAVALFSLITALLGVYWDISLHIAEGRDVGPLANPAHYLIMFGLFGIFTSGVLVMVLPVGERPSPVAVRITRDWYAPLGGVMIAGAGLFALAGFPFDDVWHRLFGQDVTVWGPTHLMMIGGAVISLVGLAVLDREGRMLRTPDVTPLGLFVRRCMIMGGFLIGMALFEAEWEFGVPQFRMVLQPLLLALAAGAALVAARMWIGPGGALGAVSFYVGLRGLVSIIVGLFFAKPIPAFPVFLVEALGVELAALALSRRPVAFGTVSGVLIGTVGFAAEYAWTQFAFPLPWTADILIEGPVMAVAGGVAGGVAGVLLALGLRGQLPRPALARPLFAGALLVLVAAMANGLVITIPGGVRADVSLTEVASPGPARMANAVVRIVPPNAADRPSWLTITAWQGGGLYVDHLVPRGDGSYRTTAPVPLSGTWKTLVRLQDGRVLTAVPLYLPEDTAIGKPELPAPPRFTRDAINEKLIMQREIKEGVPGWLWNTASAVVLICAGLIVLGYGWGVSRIAGSPRPRSREAAEGLRSVAPAQ